MVQFYDAVPPHLQEWANAQQIFFTASSPLAGKHVNISPKGLPSSTFTIFDPNHAAYVDGTGSGSETISHVYENGRITIMFCSFSMSPRIMRFFCTGKVVEWDQPAFEPLLKRMGKGKIEGARAVILLDIFKVQTSCGYGVPFLSASPLSDDDESPDGAEAVLRDRETMGHWASKKIEKNELRTYQADNNANSLDGLTGLRTARRDRGEHFWITDTRAWANRIASQREALFVGFLMGALLVLCMQLGLQLFSSNALLRQLFRWI